MDTATSGGNDYSSLRHHKRIALLTDGFSTPFLAKTAISLLRYRTADIVGIIDQSESGRTAQELFDIGGELPVVAALNGLSDADSIYIGIAPPGGKLPAAWRSIVVQGIERKLDIVSGLHDFLTEDAQFCQLATQSGSQLIDVRKNGHRNTATGYHFGSNGVRIHSVGHDCSIGKMVTTIEIQLAMQRQGLDAKFIATGQTGIMIAGEGVPVDCVVGDFVNGSIEELVIRHEGRDFLLIEGQGSISHPAYSAVTTGLLHGCAPDGLIFCYEAGRSGVKGFADLPIPPAEDQMQALHLMANLRHPCKFIGIAINGRNLSAEQTATEVENAQQRFGLPACDVYRDGAEKLVTACIQLRAELRNTERLT